jgi:hypothetical protein
MPSTLPHAVLSDVTVAFTVPTLVTVTVLSWILSKRLSTAQRWAKARHNTQASISAPSTPELSQNQPTDSTNTPVCPYMSAFQARHGGKTGRFPLLPIGTFTSQVCDCSIVSSGFHRSSCFPSAVAPFLWNVTRVEMYGLLQAPVDVCESDFAGLTSVSSWVHNFLARPHAEVRT